MYSYSTRGFLKLLKPLLHLVHIKPHFPRKIILFKIQLRENDILEKFLYIDGSVCTDIFDDSVNDSGIKIYLSILLYW